MKDDSEGHGFIQLYFDRPDRGDPGNADTISVSFVDERDESVLREKGITFLRRLRLYRLTRDAERQGHILSYRDVSSLLLTSLSTIKRDVAYFRRIGLDIPIGSRRRRSSRSESGYFSAGMTGSDKL